jgi:hypothetical protein
VDLAPKGQRRITLCAEARQRRKGIGFLTQYLTIWAGRVETETSTVPRSELERNKVANVETSNVEVIAAKSITDVLYLNYKRIAQTRPDSMTSYGLICRQFTGPSIIFVYEERKTAKADKK